MESFGKSHAHEVGDNSKCATHGKVGIFFFQSICFGSWNWVRWWNFFFIFFYIATLAFSKFICQLNTALFKSRNNIEQYWIVIRDGFKILQLQMLLMILNLKENYSFGIITPLFNLMNKIERSQIDKYWVSSFKAK